MDNEVGLLTGRANRGCCSPGTMRFRFLMLVFIAFVCFGSYYSYDEIQNLKSLWTDEDSPDYLGIDKTEYSLLYSIYSIPNTVLVFIGGLIGDRIGLRLAALIFGSFVFAGTLIVALAPTILSGRKAWMMMVGGRLCLGIGAESLNVIQTAMTSVWFDETKYLAMAFGLSLSMSRLGDFFAVSGGGIIASSWGYRWVLWIGVVLTGLSFLSIIVYGLLDKWSERYVPKKARPPEKINIKAVFRFDARFWLVSLVTVLYYGGVTPFLAAASDFLVLKYKYSIETAGLISSLILVACIILSPILGRVVDAVGYRPYFVVFGGLAILPAHLLLALTDFTPMVPIVVIGLSFSLVPAALWPSVPLLVPEEEVATAFGAMTAIQNAGLAIVNLGIGKVVDMFPENKTLGYEWVMVCLAVMDVAAICLGQVLLWVDRFRDRKLCTVTKQNNEQEATTINSEYYNPPQ